MTDWLFIATLLGVVALHWLVELIPGRERTMWLSELSLEAAPRRSAPRQRNR